MSLTADLSAYTGDVLFGFRYWTDGAVVGNGLMVDEISVNGSAPDGAETNAGWTLAAASGSPPVLKRRCITITIWLSSADHGYDKNLEVGPYNFGFLDNPALGNWVEHFPYQDGLLISYWDTSQSNNNTASHPGQGLILPIDAHPKSMTRADGGVWRNRIPAYEFDLRVGADRCA